MEPEERLALGEFTLRGVVTWQSGSSARTTVVIDDGTGGVFVNLYPLSRATPEAPLALSPIGTLIEVRGSFGQLLQEPRFAASALHELGPAPLPGARESDFSRCSGGIELFQRVHIQGVVQKIERLNGSRSALTLVTPGGALRVSVPRTPDAELDQWIDSRVKVAGTVMGIANPLNETVGYQLIASVPGDVEVLARGPASAFDAPALALSDIPALRGRDIPRQRRRIEGVITYASRGVLYLQDAGFGIRAETNKRPPLSVGDLAQLSGFLATDGRCWSLTYAQARKIGTARQVLPRDLTPADVFADSHGHRLRNEVEAFGETLVRLRAEFLDMYESGDARLFSIRFGPDILTAALDKNGTDAPMAPRPGAQVDVTGVLVLEREIGNSARGEMVPTRLNLLLRDHSDIRILRQGTWWTRQRLSSIAVGSASLAAVFSVWSAFLLRRVRRHTLDIERRDRAQRTLDIQQETTLRERERIAGELHDGIQQLLAGLCFHLEAAEGPSGDPRQHILNARSIVARIRDEFRRCLWELGRIGHHRVDPAHSLQRIAAMQHLCSDTHVDVTVEGAPGPVPSPVMASLSLVVREAIHNAVRHGAAKRVAIGLRGDAEGLVLDISDDGCGFAPAAQDAMPNSHHGLRNMRQRIAALGGTLAIDSQPGHGTRLTARIPAAALATDRAPNEHPENLPET